MKKYAPTSHTNVYSPLALALAIAAINCHAQPNTTTGNGATKTAPVEEVKVWGKVVESDSSAYTNPNSFLTQEDFASINAATTEDLVKYEPSLVIRRRFIGDSNGTLGIRGSNMFQTSRSMVFADGVPLHYLLQSRWSGAPRWTMVSASEIAEVNVLYGPFSAEYSGNSMGGVVLIETAIPQKREFHVDMKAFRQSFDEYGFDDDLNGYKGFVSYGDKIGDLSIYASYNRLDNESQPQSFFNGSNAAAGAAVTGAITKDNERGQSTIFYGDSGVIDSVTNNYKIKLGYDFGNISTLLNVAYEKRRADTDSTNNYIKDAAGNPVWSGNVSQNGQSFSIKASSLGVSEQERDSLSIGLRIKGDWSDNVRWETNLSHFAIIKDETRKSSRNPADPAFDGSGQVSDFDDTGWNTADIKVTIDDAWMDGLQLVTGVRYERYELNTRVFDSNNFKKGTKSAPKNTSGGKSSLAAAFIQANWDIDENWTMALGGRYEYWKSEDGYFSNDIPATPQLDEQGVPSRSERKFSPKFSIGYTPDDIWRFRYSIAKAYRFPIVEEMFSQFKAFNAISVSNPNLKPEDGLHHNIMIEKGLETGYVRMNLFWENIDDVIESQTTTLNGGGSLRTFIPVDEVETRGVEFIANLDSFVASNLDIRFNLTWTDAEIRKNDANPSLEGNKFTRLPRWRSNLLATYHLSDRWDLGGSVQYLSDRNNFGRLDNKDTEENVFRAQDGFTIVGLKTTFKVDKHLSLNAGIDNLTDETAYVAHPWPGRTLYMGFAYDL